MLLQNLKLFILKNIALFIRCVRYYYYYMYAVGWVNS